MVSDTRRQEAAGAAGAPVRRGDTRTRRRARETALRREDRPGLVWSTFGLACEAVSQLWMYLTDRAARERIAQRRRERDARRRHGAP